MKDKYKISAMKIVYSFVYKGMDDPLKLELTYQIQFIEILRNFQIKYQERDENGD